MSRWKILSVVTAAVSVGVLVATLLPAASQVSGERFVLCEKNGDQDYETDIDNGRKGPSAGDVFIFSEPEFDKDGNHVGKVFGKGTILRLLDDDDGVSQLNVSINLKGGRLELQGSTKFSNFGGKLEFAVVGGTGKYAGRDGTATIADRKCPGFDNGDRVTIELT
ncbi:MAG: hypothetical protein QOG54_2158 [Actinomycetota bacterium]|nr:hypothetical protein [Actinomycetota bacterium]